MYVGWLAVHVQTLTIKQLNSRRIQRELLLY